MLIVPVVVTAYIATNLDNLLLLIGLLAQYATARRNVLAGYTVGMLALGLASLAIGKAAEAIPVAYLGWLGLIPIAAGVYALLALLRAPTADAPSPSRAGPVFVVAALTQLSNGADTIATFSILVADSASGVEPWLFTTFIAMIAVFAATASFTLAHPWLGGAATRYSRYITPFLMIAIGSYVLANTLTDVAPG